MNSIWDHLTLHGEACKIPILAHALAGPNEGMRIGRRTSVPKDNSLLFKPYSQVLISLDPFELGYLAYQGLDPVFVVFFEGFMGEGGLV